MPDSIRVLLADDQHVVRAGLRSLLEREAEIEIVGEAADGEQAIALAKTLAPDIILLELIMPNKSGLDAIVTIRQHNPDARILVLTGFDNDDLVLAALKAGAAGYLLKTTAIDDLIKAIRTVHAGETPLHPSIASKLVRELTQQSPPPTRPAELTRREVEILHLVARGLSNQEIAQALFVAEPTVRTHMNRLLKKLHIDSRTQAALYALKMGLADLGNRER